MDYIRIYNSIINRRKETPIEGYSERHHIVPRSLGGSNDKSNIVKLSAREHFICHWLLVKIHKNCNSSYHSMMKAFGMMRAKSPLQQRYTSKAFERLKIDFSKTMSESQFGERNSQHKKRWISNKLTKETKKISCYDDIPEGWELGRNTWNKKIRNGRVYTKTKTDEYALSLLLDYESGVPMKDLLLKYERKTEQSITAFLNIRFPHRKKFKPNERISRL